MKKNCINTIRLLAALQVVFGHVCTHLQIQLPKIVGVLLDFFPGVPIFFTLSGFLIWDSVGRSKNFRVYIEKRFWRIYPELWGGLALEIVTLLVFYREHINYKDLGLFTITQGTFLQFWTPDSLRGYGCGTPNGSLWTICVLIQFYIIVWFLRKWLHNKNMRVWLFWFCSGVLVSVAQPIFEKLLPMLVFKLYCNTVIPYLWLFIFGAFLAEKREKILPYMMKWWWLFMIAAQVPRVIGYDIRGSYGIVGTCLGILWILGFAYKFPRINLQKDISYGIYIYHMIVVNVLITLGFTGKWISWIIVLGLTCGFAWISSITLGSIKIRKRRD